MGDLLSKVGALELKLDSRRKIVKENGRENADKNGFSSLNSRNMDQNIFSSQSLLQAVQKDRHGEVVARLNAREDVNKKFTMGRTALHAAAGKDNSKSVLILLEDRRINIEVSDSFGNRALHLASSRDRASASVSVVEELVKAGAMLDCQDKAGRTPLMKAVMAGNMAVARLLLEAGACRDLKESTGKTALDLACQVETTEMIETVFSTARKGRKIEEVENLNKSLERRNEELEKKNIDAVNEVVKIRQNEENLNKLLSLFEKEQREAQSEVARMKRKCEDMEEERTCLVCQDNRVNVAFIPCGHLCCCEACSNHSALTSCPFCRNQIERRQKIFFN